MYSCIPVDYFILLLGCGTRNTAIKIESVDGDNRALEFATAIRVGDEAIIKTFLEDTTSDILDSKVRFDLKIKLTKASTRNGSKKQSSVKFDTKPLEMATMVVFPLHLAILAKQDDIVRIILNHALNKNNNPIEAVKKTLAVRTEIQFPQESPEMFSEADRMLDGMNPMHIATKYHSQSLQAIIQFLIEEDLMDNIGFLLEEGEKHVGNTPLHFAATCTESTSLRYIMIVRLSLHFL